MHSTVHVEVLETLAPFGGAREVTGTSSSAPQRIVRLMAEAGRHPQPFAAKAGLS